MAEMHETGKKGERIAAAFLADKGYRIVETNWQSNHQEVDIIAEKDNLLVIVEVKSRRSSYFGDPEASVTRQKQKMLIKAANHFIASRKLDMEVRFDIIAIILHNNTKKINHIENAFYPTLY
jgi:putative endonuclease